MILPLFHSHRTNSTFSDSVSHARSRRHLQRSDLQSQHPNARMRLYDDLLLNGYYSTRYDFNAGISLMLYRNLVSVIIVSMLSFFGVVSTEPLTWRLIKVWMPVNIIFVGMLITNMFSLKYINVAMVTVLKNVTNVMTAVGEMYLFQKHHDNRVWAALFLMIISAISGGITDLSFHAVGYLWQLLNCFFYCFIFCEYLPFFVGIFKANYSFASGDLLCTP